MTVKEIYIKIDEFAPFNTQESWDNSGILIGDVNKNVNNILIVLDINEEVIKEAINKKIDLIITHHPIIFNPLKNILNNTLVYQLIKEDIAVISAHTNLDIAKNGINDILAKKINLKNIKPLTQSSEKNYVVSVFVPTNSNFINKLTELNIGTINNYTSCSFKTKGKATFIPNDANPHVGENNKLNEVEEVKIELLVNNNELNILKNFINTNHPYEVPVYYVYENLSLRNTNSLGLVGDIEKTLAKDYIKEVKEILNIKSIKLSNPNKLIKKVAICGGSGRSLIKDAISKNVDLFITSELKHNDYLDNDISLADCGHYETEKLGINNLKNILDSKLDDINIYISDKDKPYEYI